MLKRKHKPLKLNKLKYDKNCQYMKLFFGMPIIARINSKSFDICNDDLFTIQK